jgi:hypothetical protein
MFLDRLLVLSTLLITLGALLTVAASLSPSTGIPVQVA